MALWRVRATVDDRPGFLAVLAASLALRSVNILSVGVHVTEAGAVDDFLVDAPDELTEQQLLESIARGRGREAWVGRARAHQLVDAPTRALDLATLVVRRPEAVGEALAELLDATVTWRPAEPRLTPAEVAYGPAGTRMLVPAPGGGAWRVTRAAPEFTPAEYARAQALLALAAAGSEPAPPVVVLADGRELTIRRGEPADLAAVQRMHRRCSPTSLYLRYLAGTRGPSQAQLTRLLQPVRGAALVVETTVGDTVPDSEPVPEPAAGEQHRQIIGMANLVREGAQAEVALLVEDAWQRCGIGTVLLRRAADLARAAGAEVLVVHSHTHNLAVRRTLRRLPGARRTETDGGLVTVTLPLGDHRTEPART